MFFLCCFGLKLTSGVAHTTEWMILRLILPDQYDDMMRLSKDSSECMLIVMHFREPTFFLLRMLPGNLLVCSLQWHGGFQSMDCQVENFTSSALLSLQVHLVKDEAMLFWYTNVCYDFSQCGDSFLTQLSRLPSPQTNSSPLKIGRAPKGNDHLPTMHFQGLAVSFREGKSLSLRNIKAFCWVAGSESRDAGSYGRHFHGTSDPGRTASVFGKRRVSIGFSDLESRVHNVGNLLIKLLIQLGPNQKERLSPILCPTWFPSFCGVGSSKISTSTRQKKHISYVYTV